MTIHDPIKVVGDVIELYGNPVGKYTGPDHRKDELENAFTGDYTSTEYEEAVEAAEEEGNETGKIEIWGYINEEFDARFDRDDLKDSKDAEAFLLFFDKLMNDTRDRFNVS